MPLRGGIITPIDIGIIGAGWICEMILDSLQKKGKDKFNLTAVCDVNTARLQELKSKYAIDKIYTSADELIKDSKTEIIVIATPPFLHFEMGKKALEAGKHLFLEKPGSLTVEQIKELVDISSRKGLKATIDYVMRRNPLYIILKKICDAKIFGFPERAYLENYAHDDHLLPSHWFWDYEKSGGIWVEHGVHFFDIVNWLFKMPVKVQAINFVRKGEALIDRVYGFSLHEGNVVISYYHSFTKPEAFEKTSFHFIFDRAYAKVNGWIPEKLEIEALLNKEEEEFLTKTLLRNSDDYLPGVNIDINCNILAEYKGDSRFFKGKGKSFTASRRVKFEFSLKQDRWEVYKSSIFKGIEDLTEAIKGKKESPEVTLEDALNSLKIARDLEKNSIKI
ncbi:Gfo/Idh/MocA family protein [Thermovenabulum sp.]|uniref:Gfo/Idh/MocA family protein n=1 Tax=Thermovenabulum sp. TaxID=3100335 RepID=UPI003C7E3525